MNLRGGEAEQVSNAKAGVGSYAWSLDSKRIAYIMNDPETEQEEKVAKEKRDMVVEDTNFKYGHLYVIPFAKDDKGTRKALRLTDGSFHVTSFCWSPDGKTIVFAHQATPLVDDWQTSDISIVPSDSGAVKSLVKWRGSDASPRYSPDGRWILFASDKGDLKWAQISDLYVIAAEGGESRKLAETPDRNVGSGTWSADGKTIYANETDKTVSRLYALPVDGGRAHVVTTGAGNYSGMAISKDGNTMSFIHQTPEIPPDIYVTQIRTFEPRKLTSIHTNLPTQPLGRTEVINWKSKDGKGDRRASDISRKLREGGPLSIDSEHPWRSSRSLHSDLYRSGKHLSSAGLRTARVRHSASKSARKQRLRSGLPAANINDWGFGDYEDDQKGLTK